jgi:hypothetical protein
VRNADDSDWIVIGTIESDGTPKLNATSLNLTATDVPNTPSGTISATNVQSAVNSLNVLPLLLRSTAYSIDDVVFYAGLPSAMYLQCTTAGTTASGDIVIPPPVAVGDTITDGTVTWTVQKVGNSNLADYTTTVNSPMFNKRDIITTSGTYTAPVTGWYKITVKGAGGGGGGSRYVGSVLTPSGGGGEGGTTIAYERMTAGDTATVTIGAGGTGATASANTTTTGGNGGDSSVIVNSNTYTAGGGKGGTSYNGEGGAGGIGTIYGSCGYTAQKIISSGTNDVTGGSGGGAGGALGTSKSNPTDGVNGGGGAGGSLKSSTTIKNGTNGGDGFAWFEYFDSSLNP